MKKILLACVCLASLGAFGCSDPCGDLADEVRECCGTLTEPAKGLCEASATAYEEAGDDDACQAVLDAGYQCGTTM